MEEARTIVNGKNKVIPPLLYIGVVKIISATCSAGPKRSEITKRLGGENDPTTFAQKNLKYQPATDRLFYFRVKKKFPV